MSCQEPPSLSLLHLYIFNLPSHVLLRKHHLQQEKQPKKQPLEEKPHDASLADAARYRFAPGSSHPTATTVPNMAFPGHPI